MNTITPPAVIETTVDLIETISSLQQIIARNAQALREVKAKKKLIAEQEKDLLLNDSDLKKAEEEAEQYLQKIKEQKIKIKQSQESVQLKSKKAELVEEEKELQETLSNHLVNYYSMTKSSVVDTDSGEQIQMTIKATISAKQLALF